MHCAIVWGFLYGFYLFLLSDHLLMLVEIEIFF